MPSWNHDGTQDPGPPPMMPDPLSGLVTGGKYDAESVRVRVVEPTMPDIEAVREAMASVLDEDSELMIRPVAPARRAVPEPPPPPPNPGANDPDAGDGGEGVGPAADTANPPTPPVGIPVPPRRVPPGQVEIPVQRGWRRERVAGPAKRSSWSPGLAAVGLLLLVIGVLVIVMLASLIDTIASIFS